MKYLFGAALALSIFVASCKPSNPNPARDCSVENTKANPEEVVALQAYLDSNNIVAIKDDRGFFYKETAVGSTGNNPRKCDNVTVKYRGYLKDGSLFDQNSRIEFNLSQVIKGWQQAIPLMKTGGKITLYLPPSLGYGENGTGAAIGPNTTLIFDIELLSTTRY